MNGLREVWIRFRFRVLMRIRARVWPWCNEPGCWARSHRGIGRPLNACSYHAMKRIQRVVMMSDEEFDRT